MYRTQGDDGLLTLVSKATVFIYNKHGSFMRALGIYGRCLIMPHHYCFPLRDTSVVRIKTNLVDKHVCLSDVLIHHEPERDLMVWHLPPDFPSFPSIVDRFADEEDIMNLGEEIHYFDAMPDTQPVRNILRMVSYPDTRTWIYSDFDDPSGVALKMHEYSTLAIMAQHTTYPGDCGSLYTAPQTAAGCPKLLGIHVAGTTGTAICATLTSDYLYIMLDTIYQEPTVLGSAVSPMLDTQFVAQSGAPGQTLEVFDDYESDTSDTEEPLLLNHEYPPVVPDTFIVPKWEIQRDSAVDGSFQRKDEKGFLTMPAIATPVGKLARPVHANWNTAYKTSKLAPFLPLEAGEQEYAPAVLSHRSSLDGSCPLDLAFKRQIPISMDSYDSQVMKECITAAIRPLGVHPRRKVRSPVEAVRGTAIMGTMEPHSSAGFPWNQYASHLGLPQEKGSFFKIDGRKTSIDKMVLTEVENAMASLRQGITFEMPVVAQLKDEVVPMSKVTTCKTRLYYVASIVHALLGRMLFMDFISQMLKDRAQKPLTISCAVGLTSADYVMNQYASIYAKGAHVSYAADQKGWDNHQHWEFAQYIAEAINEWYNASDPSDDVARTTYLRSCYNSIYISGSTVYRMPFGLPSGMCLTSHMNSLYLEMTTLYAIHDILVNHTPPGFKPPTGHVVTPFTIKAALAGMFYGDDSLFLLPKYYGITSQALFAAYRRLGLEATHCIKDHPLDQEIPFEQQTFLKRTFSLNEEGHMTFRLDKETIVGSLRWVKSKNYNKVSVLENTVRNAQLEASRHGTAYFNELSAKIRRALAEAKIYGVVMYNSIAEIPPYSA